MKAIDLPKYLYKFVTWEKEFHKDIIKKNTIFFPSVDKFNDPFDSSVPLRYDYGTKDQIIDLYKAHLRLDNPTIDFEQIEKLANEFYNKNIIKNPREIKENIEFQHNWAKTKYGIFVLTTELQNILMWSHYSSSHTGICLRFNTENFRKFIEFDCVKNGHLIMWDKVTYEDKYPLLNPFNLDETEVVTKSLTVKSLDWEYENEYRFILFDKPNTPIILPHGIIEQVICGCKMQSSSIDEIIDIAKNNSLSVLKSKLKENYFGLDFEQIY